MARPVADSDAVSRRRIFARGSSPPAFEGGADHLHAADDHREQIVEVVCDAAGELPDRLQLLCMPQHLFGLAALGDLDLEAAVGLGQLARPLGDLQLQALVHPAHRLLRAAHPQQCPRRRQQFLGLDRLHQEAIRPAVQREAPGRAD